MRFTSVGFTSVGLTSVRFSSVRFLSLFALTLLLFFGGFAGLDLWQSVEAQSEQSGGDAVSQNREFEWPPGFEGRIEFWRHIYTKYGENQRVFHHRERPAIIYSVLDFSEYEANHKGKKLQRLKEKSAKEEIQRIRNALLTLAKGRPAKTALEQRIVKLFTQFHEATPAAYRYAADKKIVRYQRGIKERFRDGLVRSGRYLDAIEEIFAKEGLPLGLARLPLVESSFDYKAYSSVGAAGIWQFIRSTGRRYMRVSSAIDERRDPIIASRAAAKYLKNSYSQLGRWPLAITSYNHGLAGVKRAVKQTGSKDLAVIVRNYDGKRFGFASSNFYAEFLAAVEVDRNAQLYFPGLVREKRWYFDEVRLGKRVTFSQLVKLSGSSKEELGRLNLAFRSAVLRGRTGIPAGSVVKVPKGAAQRVIAGISRSSEVRLASNVTRSPRRTRSKSSSSYRVKRGDTVGAIARRFGVSKSELMSFNGISNPRKLYAGKKIRIPGSGASGSGTASAEGKNVQARIVSTKEYKVQAGDSLSVIASKFGTSSAAIRRANGMKGSRIYAGKKLKIPGSRAASSSSAVVDLPDKRTANAKLRHYTVKSGDNLTKISRKVGVSVSQLMRLNPKAKRTIFPGQKLVIE